MSSAQVRLRKSDAPQVFDLSIAPDPGLRFDFILDHRREPTVTITIFTKFGDETRLKYGGQHERDYTSIRENPNSVTFNLVVDRPQATVSEAPESPDVKGGFQCAMQKKADELTSLWFATPEDGARFIRDMASRAESMPGSRSVLEGLSEAINQRVYDEIRELYQRIGEADTFHDRPSTSLLEATVKMITDLFGALTGTAGSDHG